MEQICHHPPISYFQLIGKNFKLEGGWEITASMHTNGVSGKAIGVPKITFKNNNNEIYFTTPNCEISGTMFGQRSLNFEGKSLIFNPKHCLFAEITFNPDKKNFITGLFSKAERSIDVFTGSIYQVTKQFMDNFLKESPLAFVKKFPGLSKDKTKIDEFIVEEKIGIDGIWHSNLNFDKKNFWKIEDYLAYQLEGLENPIPSDSIYREDLIVWKSKSLEKAQEAKEKLENIQRKDRKLRNEFKKNKNN